MSPTGHIRGMISQWYWVSLLYIICDSFSGCQILCSHIPNNLHLILLIVVFNTKSLIPAGHLFELALKLLSPLDKLRYLVNAEQIEELENADLAVFDLA